MTTCAIYLHDKIALEKIRHCMLFCELTQFIKICFISSLFYVLCTLNGFLKSAMIFIITVGSLPLHFVIIGVLGAQASRTSVEENH